MTGQLAMFAGDTLVASVNLPGLNLYGIGPVEVTVEGFEGGRRAALGRDADGLLWRITRDGDGFAAVLTEESARHLQELWGARGASREGATC